MRRWWLDEIAHAGEEHLDAHYVAGYDRKAGFDPTEDIDALRRHGLGGESIVVDAGFLSYEHRGPPVDVVFTRNALHQLPDFWKAIALERMATLLAPDGVLRLRDLVFDFDPRDVDERVEAWMAGAVTESSAGWTADELAGHVRGEFSTYSWLLDVMLDRTGFDIVDREFRRSAYGTYTCHRRG